MYFDLLDPTWGIYFFKSCYSNVLLILVCIICDIYVLTVLGLRSVYHNYLGYFL